MSGWTKECDQQEGPGPIPGFVRAFPVEAVRQVDLTSSIITVPLDSVSMFMVVGREYRCNCVIVCVVVQVLGRTRPNCALRCACPLCKSADRNALVLKTQGHFLSFVAHILLYQASCADCLPLSQAIVAKCASSKHN